MRVITGASLSILDMITDISVSRMYLGIEGEEGYGIVLLWMIGGCICIQLVYVFIQNRKNLKRLAQEVVIVLICAKPGKENARV
jgi:hypothetical protein